MADFLHGDWRLPRKAEDDACCFNVFNLCRLSTPSKHCLISARQEFTAPGPPSRFRMHQSHTSILEHNHTYIHIRSRGPFGIRTACWELRRSLDCLSIASVDAPGWHLAFGVQNTLTRCSQRSDVSALEGRRGDWSHMASRGHLFVWQQAVSRASPGVLQADAPVAPANMGSAGLR